MLPTQKTPPRPNLCDLTVLVYGPHKYGKSEFCSQAEHALFLATEPGLNSLEVYQQPIGTWDELLIAARDIAEGKHTFRTVIIDTIDNAYRMCAEYICQRYKVEHESDLEYGKGYALVNAEFHRVLNKLALLPYGLFLVSHSQDKEIETRTGKYTKVVPTLPDKARKLVLGLVDIILFCDLEPTTAPDGKPAYRRVLRTKPSTAYEAGDRTRRLPEVIDLSFAAFVAAFAQGAPRAALATTSSPASTAAPTGTAAPSTSSASGPAPSPATPSPATANAPVNSPPGTDPPPATSARGTDQPRASSASRTNQLPDKAVTSPPTTAKPRPAVPAAPSATSSPRASTAAPSTTPTTAAAKPRASSATSR